jgi:hypothetical protein
MIEIIKKNKLLAAVSLAYIFLFIAMPDKAYLSVKNSIYYIIEMLEIMPVIFILTSIIEAWVPKEVIMNGFGEKAGIKGGDNTLLLQMIFLIPSIIKTSMQLSSTYVILLKQKESICLCLHIILISLEPLSTGVV